MNEKPNVVIVRDSCAAGLHLVKKPVRRAEYAAGLREGSTGRVMVILPQDLPSPLLLPQVWAVAEPEVVPVLPDNSQSETKPTVELAFYRKYTEALLRRYLRLSMQSGRVPSLLSKDLFRGQVTRYSVRGFEEVVIFCHDVERRLDRLNETDRQIIKRVVLQRYSLSETACILGVSLRSMHTYYGQAIDRVTAMLLEVGLLDMGKL
ncbi:sigma-70 region 4 domain-containing protein [Granulicella paludicola]|uniref:sigma-70 region 4 domain-containing protein n=1 Tax=Granulicella paludicola TaxID=474951 RepID=UPI0021DFCEBA|nr:sigma-70 region 4 domain-containing protein [Granulicella paludicola]